MLKEISEIILDKYWDDLDSLGLVQGDSPESFVSNLINEILRDTIKLAVKNEREELLRPILEVIKERENRQHIGTIVRIYRYCKQKMEEGK